MALDQTARESNVRDSIKKYFVDSIYTTEGIDITFDIMLSTPNMRSKTIDKWVSINIGSMQRDTLSYVILEIYCCTRKDSEGFKLAQLTDKVLGYLTDTTTTDGLKRIPFYRSYENQAWTLIDSLVVISIDESPQNVSDDETKYKQLTAKLVWAAKV